MNEIMAPSSFDRLLCFGRSRWISLGNPGSFIPWKCIWTCMSTYDHRFYYGTIQYKTNEVIWHRIFSETMSMITYLWGTYLLRIKVHFSLNLISQQSTSTHVCSQWRWWHTSLFYIFCFWLKFMVNIAFKAY